MKRISTFLRILFILLFLYATSNTLIAQTGDWGRTGADIDGLVSGDNFGNSISLSSDGTVIAIGAYSADSNGADAGQVRIFENQSGTWVQKGQNINGEAAGDWSGKSVSLNSDGSIVAIGAFWNDAGDGIDSKKGQVRVFTFNTGNSTWEQVGADINGENTNDEAGWSVSINADGTIVAVGEQKYDNGANADAGRVRIFQNQSGTWTQIGAIVGEAAGDQSGRSVSLSAVGTIVAIGANLNDGNGTNSGHVRIYQNQAGTWVQIGADIDGEAAGDQSGNWVSLSGDGSTVAIGAYLNSGGGTNAGHVRVYNYQGASWTKKGQDIDGAAGDQTARYSVSLNSDGSVVAIGGEYHDGPAGIDQGYTRVFAYNSGNSAWEQVGSNIYGEAADDRFGVSVSISANGAVVGIGGYFNDIGGTKVNAGHVRVYSFKTDATWAGTVSTDWQTAGNWDIAVVPNVNLNAIIPGGLTNYPTIASAATCYNLTMESTAGSTGSILGQSNLTVSGTTTIKRQMSGNAWHFVASPVPGQTISTFLAANANIPTKNVSGIDRRGMMDYNESINNWNSFFTDADAGTLASGKGYSLRTVADGTVTFTGALQKVAVNPAVSSTGNLLGWNCIGNPYPSAIFVNSPAQATNNFIDLNDANFDPSYKAVYVWEQGNNAYTIVNNGSAAYTAALGQAFMVKANTGVTQMSFTTNLQTHAPTAALKSSIVSIPEIRLIAQLSNQKSSTVIKFDDGMSTGLDVGYDAGILKSGFDVYTSLIENNGVDFGMQFLPTLLIDKSEIALGLESKNSGLVTFSAVTENLPVGSRILLEDRLLGTFTELNENETYTANIEKDELSKGRFYLHTSNSVTRIGDISGKLDFSVYYANDKINIAGQVEGKAIASLFDLMGRRIKVLKLEKTPLNFISTSDLNNGVYMLNIQYEGGSYSKKVIVSK